MTKKDPSESGESREVTFELPADVNAQTANLVGEFNDWDQASHPMKRNDDGSFTLTVALNPGQSYRFRYLLDGERWENDWAADAYWPNDFGSEDSVAHV